VIILRPGLAAAVGGAIVVGMAACSPSPAPTRFSAARLPLTAVTRVPSSAVSVLAGADPGVLSAEFARTLFVTSPVVVVAAADGGALAVAAKAALAAHAPLLLASTVTPQLGSSVRRLRPRVVLVVGLPAAVSSALAGRLRGVQVVGRAARLPVTAPPVPLSQVGVLVSRGSTGPAVTAVTATAQAAGAAVIGVRGGDPRADPAAISALARLRPVAVVGVGARFGSASRLGGRLAVAETGRQLPGGGQVLFPGHRLVALYGHPGAPGLGALGQQDLTASIALAKRMAVGYRPFSDVPVVPAFEIIATVAQASPGTDGSYSYESPVSSLRPWVDAATAAGLYVVLDLQPGRARLLRQAERYQPLLRQPDVGLALDPEWELQPGQAPLQQVGHVDIDEVNGVARWLAALTTRYHLPQKLLVLHQFQLQMIAREGDLDTSYDNLAIVIHMDGQGTPADKQDTWNAVTAAAPPGVYFGWKDFFLEDHPMLTPQQTQADAPAAVMVSYQLRRRVGRLPLALLPGCPQVVPDGEQPDVEPVDHEAPQPAPREQRDRDGHDAEDDQVPGVV
jgi:hypothetical protein